MGLIIKDRIPMLKKGYPTVSDKYNVTGGILTGDYPAPFGSVVKIEGQGYFSTVNASNKLTAAGQIGGIVLATNVKMPSDWPANTVQVDINEAFNLFMDGFVAVELDDGATIANIVPNAPVYVTDDGYFTDSSSSTFALAGAVFTGCIENIGTTASPVYLAEIYVK